VGTEVLGRSTGMRAGGSVHRSQTLDPEDDMNNRRKVAAAAVTGLGAAALLRDARRRATAAQMIIRARDVVLGPRPVAAAGPDVAHAPGHRHLPPPAADRAPEEAEQGAFTVVSHHPGHVHKG
jgi:hypothetical protein